jgi:hypothetical protein
LINGFGTGILNAIVPVWATESVPHTSRGQFITIEFTLIRQQKEINAEEMFTIPYKAKSNEWFGTKRGE